MNVSVLPVCPVCREHLDLGSAFCGGCGSAVRPTCPQCAEPLEVGVSSCPGCGAAVGRDNGSTAVDVERYAAAASTDGVFEPLEMPVDPDAPPLETLHAPPEPEPPKPKRRRRTFRRIVSLVVLVVVAAAGIGALAHVGRDSGEDPPSSPGTIEPAFVELVTRDFTTEGFGVAYPSTWRVQSRPEAGVTVVSFSEPAASGLPRRGFYVVGQIAQLADARKSIADFPKSLEDYRLVAVVDNRIVSGRPAIRHVFLSQNRRFDQWWVEHPGGVFRITFWAPQDDSDAGDVVQRILSTFRVLGGRGE